MNRGAAYPSTRFNFNKLTIIYVVSTLTWARGVHAHPVRGLTNFHHFFFVFVTGWIEPVTTTFKDSVSNLIPLDLSKNTFEGVYVHIHVVKIVKRLIHAHRLCDLILR